MKVIKFSWWFWFGIFCLLLFFGLMVAKIKPISTYFYPFVWWSYIIFLDGLVFSIKKSSLFTRWRIKILLLIFLSFLFWIFFELLNLKINNWHYIGPSFPNLATKAIFAIISFGTVLPAIIETLEIFQISGFWRNLKILQWEWWGRPRNIKRYLVNLRYNIFDFTALLAKILFLVNLGSTYFNFGSFG